MGNFRKVLLDRIGQLALHALRMVNVVLQRCIFGANLTLGQTSANGFVRLLRWVQRWRHIAV
jgi:hypothetical protein